MVATKSFIAASPRSKRKGYLVPCLHRDDGIGIMARMQKGINVARQGSYLQINVTVAGIAARLTIDDDGRAACNSFNCRSIKETGTATGTHTVDTATAAIAATTAATAATVYLGRSTTTTNFKYHITATRVKIACSSVFAIFARRAPSTCNIAGVSPSGAA
jgi:hypothetical protein